MKLQLRTKITNESVGQPADSRTCNLTFTEILDGGSVGSNTLTIVVTKAEADQYQVEADYEVEITLAAK